MSLNKVMLIGNVGKKPEVRYIRETGSSFEKAVKVASFTLATNEHYRDREGHVRETTEWHDIAAWGTLADFVEKWVKKGATLYVEGRIRTKVWTDRDEKPHKVTEIIAGSIQMLDRKNSEASTATDAGETSTAPKSPLTPSSPLMSPEFAPDDDLPF